jgi:hypothetical protein
MSHITFQNADHAREQVREAIRLITSQEGVDRDVVDMLAVAVVSSYHPTVNSGSVTVTLHSGQEILGFRPDFSPDGSICLDKDVPAIAKHLMERISVLLPSWRLHGRVQKAVDRVAEMAYRNLGFQRGGFQRGYDSLVMDERRESKAELHFTIHPLSRHKKPVPFFEIAISAADASSMDDDRLVEKLYVETRMALAAAKK